MRVWPDDANALGRCRCRCRSKAGHPLQTPCIGACRRRAGPGLGSPPPPLPSPPRTHPSTAALVLKEGGIVPYPPTEVLLHAIGWRVQAPDGTTLCTCGSKKVRRTRPRSLTRAREVVGVGGGGWGGEGGVEGAEATAPIKGGSVGRSRGPAPVPSAGWTSNAVRAPQPQPAQQSPSKSFLAQPPGDNAPLPCTVLITVCAGCGCGAVRYAAIRCTQVAWYLERGLAVVQAEEPVIVIRLKFEPRGRGHADDQYYLVGGWVGGR